MRRRRRIAWRMLLVLSLLLLAATFALWVNDEDEYNWVSRSSQNLYLEAVSYHGRLWFGKFKGIHPAPGWAFHRRSRDGITPRTLMSGTTNAAPIFKSRSRPIRGGAGSVFIIEISDLGLITLFAIVPLIQLIHMALRLRRLEALLAKNACTHCGYSMQGNTSGVCPECGTSIAPKVAA